MMENGGNHVLCTTVYEVKQMMKRDDIEWNAEKDQKVQS